MSISEKHDRVFKALGNQVRRQILDDLRDQPLTTGTLVAHFPELDRCTVMQHLKGLEDADRFAMWLFGRVPKGSDPKVEENVDLPNPVPVYVTYLTAEGGPSGAKFRPDPYNRDPALLARYFGDGQQQVAAVLP